MSTEMLGEAGRNLTARFWWALVVRGIFAIVFGLIALFWTGITLFALVVLFGIYAFVDGIFALISAIWPSEQHPSRALLAFEGIFGIIAGVVAFAWPGITALILLYVIAMWALITGIMEVAAAFSPHWEASNKWLLGISGVLSILLAILLAANPVSGAVALVKVIGIYAIIFGIMVMVVGFRLRSAVSTFGGRMATAS